MKYIILDRFLSMEKGRHALAVKNVTGGEGFLGLGLLGGAVMPASVIIEAMAQAAGILVAVSYDFEGKAVLAKVEEARFFRPVTAGDRLELEATMGDRRDASCHMEVTARVAADVVATMSALFACLPLASAEGQMFNTRQHHQERADLLRVLGVLDLIGAVPSHVMAPWVEPEGLAAVEQTNRGRTEERGDAKGTRTA